MASITTDTLQIILKPLMRFCLRHSVRIQEILEAVKIALIEAAKEEMIEREELINISRISVMTGIHRRDVMRIHRDEITLDGSKNFIPRLIGQWQSDKRFCVKGKKPRILSRQGEGNDEFEKLVRLVSNDLHPGTVLFELERLGIVRRVKDGVRLITAVYSPPKNIRNGFELLAEDANDLIAAVEENIADTEAIPNLHAKTTYDNIRRDALPRIRKWFLNEGSSFHKRSREFLSRFDLDINPDPSHTATGVRVVLGTFSRVSVPSPSLLRRQKQKRKPKGGKGPKL